MAIAVVCSCGKVYPIREEFAGRTVQCPDCKALLTIPASAENNEPPPNLGLADTLSLAGLGERARTAPPTEVIELPQELMVAPLPDSGAAEPSSSHEEDTSRAARLRDSKEIEEHAAGLGLVAWLVLASLFLLITGVAGLVAVLILHPEAPSAPAPEVLASSSQPASSPGGRPTPRPQGPTLHFNGQPWGGHASAILAVAFSSDGRQVLSVSGGLRELNGSRSRAPDTSLRRWEAATGKGLEIRADFPEGIAAAAFASGGRKVALALAGHVFEGIWAPGSDAPLLMGSLLDAAPLQRLAVPTGEVGCIALTSDGRHALTGCSDGTARVWDVAEGRERCCLHVPGGAVTCVAVSPDGKRALTGGSDRTVRLWDLEQGSQLQQGVTHEDPVWAVAFSPDGKYAASAGGRRVADSSAGGDCDIRLWETSSGAGVRRARGHTGWVGSLCFSPGGEQLLSGGSDAVRLWRVGTGQEEASYTGYLGGIRCLAFAPDARQALSGGEDAALRLWKLPKSVPELIHDLASNDPLLLRDAVRGLTQKAGEARPAIPALLEALTRADPALRSPILAALRKIGKPGAGAVPRLARLLEQDTDVELRLWALEALETLGRQAEPAAPGVARALKADPDARIRLQAARVLGGIGPTGRAASRQPLLAALRDSDPEVSQQAEASLARLGIPPKDELELLRRLTHDPSPAVCRYAVRTLAGLGKEARPAVADLIRVADSEAPLELRREALQALRQIQPGSKQVLDLCTRLLAEGNQSVWEEAVLVLAAAGPTEDALPALLQALSVSSRSISQVAESTIRGWKMDRRQVPMLLPLLKSSREQTRRVAIDILGRMGAEAGPAAATLGQLLRDAGTEERRLLAATLGKMGKAAEPAAPALAPCLKDREPAVALEVALALVQIEPNNEAALAVLIRQLRTLDATRDRAHKALVEAGKPALHALAQALRDTSFSRRTHTPEGVARALARQQIIQILTEMGPLAHTTEVLGALAYLEQRDPVPGLRKAAHDARLTIQREE